MADGDVSLLKGMAMEIVVGPVVTRKGGYAFDCWTPEEGFSRGTLTAGSKMPIMRGNSKSDPTTRAIRIA
jgi:hypothetical protein